MFLINRVLRFISLFQFYNRWNVIFEKFPLISLILFLFSLIIRWLNEMKEASTQFLHVLRNSKCWSKKCIPIHTLQHIRHHLEMNLFLVNMQIEWLITNDCHWSAFIWLMCEMVFNLIILSTLSLGNNSSFRHSLQVVMQYAVPHPLCRILLMDGWALNSVKCRNTAGHNNFANLKSMKS